MAGCAGGVVRSSDRDPPRIPQEQPLDPSRNLVPVDAQQGEIDPKKFQIIFIAHNFEGQNAGRPGIFFTAERLARVVQNIVQARQGIFETPPFSTHIDQFQFWLYIPSGEEALTRSAIQLCSAAAENDGIDQMNDRLEQQLRQNGMRYMAFYNLLNTDCRSQASWFKISSFARLGGGNWEREVPPVLGLDQILQEIRENPQEFLSHIDDPDELKDWLVRHIADHLFYRFTAPRAYLSLNENEVSDDQPMANRRISVAKHELGHLYFMFDLYFGREEGGFARVIQFLDRDRDIKELLGLPDRLLGVSLPEVNINLREAMMRSPYVTQLFGVPLGFPLCAPDQQTGRQWARALHVENVDGLFVDRGCLYVNGANGGPFRSDDGIMFNSANQVYGPLGEAWIEWLLTCQANPNHEKCDDLRQFGITPALLWSH